MYCVVETVEEGNRCVCTVSTSWIVDGMLCWPPASLFRKCRPVEKRTPPCTNWLRMPFKMLKDNIGNISFEFIFTFTNNSFNYGFNSNLERGNRAGEKV